MRGAELLLDVLSQVGRCSGEIPPVRLLLPDGHRRFVLVNPLAEPHVLLQGTAVDPLAKPLILSILDGVIVTLLRLSVHFDERADGQVLQDIVVAFLAALGGGSFFLLRRDNVPRVQVLRCHQDVVAGPVGLFAYVTG